jgi:hypothetical protein
VSKRKAPPTPRKHDVWIGAMTGLASCSCGWVLVKRHRRMAAYRAAIKRHVEGR